MAEFHEFTGDRWAEDQRRYCDIGPHEGKMRVMGALYMTIEEFARYQQNPGLYLPVDIPEPTVDGHGLGALPPRELWKRVKSSALYSGSRDGSGIGTGPGQTS